MKKNTRFETLAIAWIKYYLAGDASYYTYINDAMHEDQVDAGWYTEYDFLNLGL